jgi:hypothetical protein
VAAGPPVTDSSHTDAIGEDEGASVGAAVPGGSVGTAVAVGWGPVVAGAVVGVEEPQAATTRAATSATRPPVRRFGEFIAGDCAMASRRSLQTRGFPSRDVRFLTVPRAGHESKGVYGS